LVRSVNRSRQIVVVHVSELEPFSRSSGSSDSDSSPTISDDGTGSEVQRHLAGLDLRQVEDVVDQLEQVLAGVVRLVQRLVLLVVSSP
jgi:hypothetical protein